MDLSFTLDGGKLELGQVQLDDIPQAVSLLRQSFREPPLFEANGLKDLRILSTDEVYERFLAISSNLCLDPISETADMTQSKRLEKAYLYRAEIYRRTYQKSGFVKAYEAFVDRKRDLVAYNHMLVELGEDHAVVQEEYEEQRRTKELMLDILRRPQVMTEINKTIQRILDRNTNRSHFKFHLTPSQHRLILSGLIEDEPLEIQEELLASLLLMYKSL